MKHTIKIISLICGAVVASNVAAKTYDPYESFNRSMYDFNSTVDDYVAAPLANGYKFIAPSFVQTGVNNFFTNLKGINVVLNDLLQAKLTQSAADLGRFTLNTTAGIGGFVDVAKYAGLEQNEEDFDQTLAVWGVPQGAYLVLPLVGPMTMRSAPASAFDAAANPATYASIPADFISAPVQFMSALNARANAEGALKFINEAAVDKYVFTRESFLQWRKSLEKDGNVSADIDAELFTDDKELTFKWRDYQKQFESAANSFGSTAQQFDLAARNYEQAELKIENLKHSRK
ncbi:MAG: VacJ family lipoprotein [Methylococcales bacterium]|nr:VacJ family lipoprotein [Methylococcales bacterium]